MTHLGLVALALFAGACTNWGASPTARPSSATTHTAVPLTPDPGTVSPTPADSAFRLVVPRPHIVWKPIPYPESRKQETLDYAREHYGLDTFRLIHPKVIVEHFTSGTAFAPAFNTFAANAPHLGELPGTCAHFVIDTDGTIYQLVDLGLMCRHTVGLNYTAIGIEMVGRSDADILGNAPQRAAAVDLTLWLMQRFGIELRNVIGHNESLTSPYRKELVPSLRCQTHQDWTHADMEILRHDLATWAVPYGLRLGPPATPVDSGC